MGYLDTQCRIVESTRPARKGQVFPLFAENERDRLVETYHPDYRRGAYEVLSVGPNAGEKTVHELARLLEAESWVDPDRTDLTPDYETDVLIIGGGGAGATAALTARMAGAKAILSTKLRIGDSNTVMAEGGMQVALDKTDSPVIHYLDTIKGGHFKNVPGLLKALVEDGPAAAKWLSDLGVIFDREEDGRFRQRRGGGSSRPRLLTCADYTGLDIMRNLKEACVNEGVRMIEYAPAVELLSDGRGRCTGAIMKNMDNDRWIVVRAKVVILATGGSGRLHIQGFSTSNHFGATGDGLCLAYRIGARLAFMDTFQYHPTGVVYPEQMSGILVTEGIRSNGAQLVNAKGERFINELDTRDVVAAAILREVAEGRGVTTPLGKAGVWLDMPMVDMLNGEGTLEKRFPAMVRQYGRYQIDIRKQPVLIYPTLHYQNGGIQIDTNARSTIAGLLVAGEASGGVHGRNRLMGNSLLDIIVYGKRAGKTAAALASETDFGPLTLDHVKHFYAELKRKGVSRGIRSPLLFPDYVKKEKPVTVGE